jgi:poly(3-hydroxybutyrate) depolymerase
MPTIDKFASVLLCALPLSGHTHAFDVLPALNIPESNITVSGISSGGYMAQQLHTAYSERFSAVAIIAGGPFYCAENNIGVALTRCMTPNEVNKPDVARLRTLTETFAANGDISPLSNMQNDRVWIFSSANDTIVYQAISDSLVEYYGSYLKNGNLRYINNIGGEHNMPTDDFGYPCDYLGQSSNTDDHFINNCDYDAAGNLLAFSYKRIKSPKTNTLSGRFVKFDQANYISDPNSHSMAQDGYAYVPQICEKTKGNSGKLPKCKLHIALHGCLQSADRIGTTFIKNAGYNDWADRNRIVMLYPQATASVEQGNGNGCWDWWGYDDPKYSTRYANQMDAIIKMTNRITQNDSHEALRSPPEQVNASLNGAGNIVIAWEAQIGIKGYAVYRSSALEEPYFLVSADVIVANNIQLSQDPASLFYYIVVAVEADGSEGLPSKHLGVAIPGMIPAL